MKPRRKTIGAGIKALKAYPKLTSTKAASAQDLNMLFDADEALNLARHLIQGAREAKEVTIRVARKPSVKTQKHAVSVTYETARKK
jgi:hypothetical protein